MLFEKEVLIPVSISMRLFSSLPCGLVMAWTAYMYRYYALFMLTIWFMIVSVYRWKKLYTTAWTLCAVEHILSFLIMSRITMVDVYRFKWPYSLLWFVNVYVVMVVFALNEFLWYTQTRYYHLHPLNTEKIYTRYVYWKVGIHVLVAISSTLGMSMPTLGMSIR